MKRNLRCIQIFWSLVLLLGIFCAAPPAAPAEVIELTFANQNGINSWSNISAIEPWMKQVEEATGGRVKIKNFPSETLVKGKDAWTATKHGIADISWCFHGYWPGMTPLTDVMSLPALPFRTAEKGSEVFWKLYEKFPEIQKEFSDNQILLAFTSNPYVLITNKKDVQKMEDLQGMKIRMTGGPPTKMVSALKGVPMLIAMPDTYLAMDKGTIDGMGAPWEAVHGFRLYEVTKHYITAPFPAVYFTIAMNKKKWNKLPKDIQEAIMSVSGLEGSRLGEKPLRHGKRGGCRKTGRSRTADRHHRVER